jgi:hypothetical protein
VPAVKLPLRTIGAEVVAVPFVQVISSVHADEPSTLLTVPEINTTSVVPVFLTCTVAVVAVKSTLVILSSSVSMNVNVSDPIHAATAIETATVTAMSMMAATTGLRAFLLFRSFLIFGSFPPLSSHENYTVGRFKSYDSIEHI